ncbi:MAG TPA: hypothetical protein PKD26_06325 [Pyrinomonadaceae bacterium]|nr:hypothetical protein [Pyrinomonadaceae bacterium]
MAKVLCKTRTLILLTALLLTGCQSSTGLLGPADETLAAGELIKAANVDLRAIKVLFNKHTNKRQELKNAMSADDAALVRKLSDEVVDIINEGAAYGKSALDKIDKARDMNVNEDYEEYLRLKWEALNNQLNAFEEYRQAARKLRDSFDPKNARAKEEVKADFESRSENFQRLMERARDFSSQANDLAKEVHFRSRNEASK